MDIAYKKKPPKTKKCAICAEEFNTYYSFQKFCSPDCAAESRRRTTKKNNKRYAGPRKKKFEKQYGKDKVGKVRLKCKTCGKYYHRYASQVKHRGSNFCSMKCKSNVKIPNGKEVKKKTLDQLWSKIIKMRAGHKCEYCGKKEYLNSHHIFSRTNHSVRWDTENGVSLCPGHHLLSNFSAHKAPLEFAEWLKETRGQEWYDSLRARAKKPRTKKIDYYEEYVKLKDEEVKLKEYNNIIDNS